MQHHREKHESATRTQLCTSQPSPPAPPCHRSTTQLGNSMALFIPFPKVTELPRHPVRLWTLRAPSALTCRAIGKATHFPAQLQVSKDRTVHLALLKSFFTFFFLLFSLRDCGNSQQGESEASHQQTQANSIWNKQPILHLALDLLNICPVHTQTN